MVKRKGQKGKQHNGQKKRTEGQTTQWPIEKGQKDNQPNDKKKRQKEKQHNDQAKRTEEQAT